MRIKFSLPERPDENEKGFIYILEKYEELDKDELANYIFGEDNADNQRILRRYMEKYNSYKFEGIIPLGRIISHKGQYKLIRSDNELADKIRLRAKFDLICAAIDYKNTLSILGNEQVNGQQSIYDVLDKSLAELIQEAKDIESTYKL